MTALQLLDPPRGLSEAAVRVLNTAVRRVDFRLSWWMPSQLRVMAE